MKKRKNWVKRYNVEGSLNKKNSTKMFLCKLDLLKEWVKSKQYFSSDCKDQIPYQHSLWSVTIHSSWYTPLHGDMQLPLFWNSWDTYWEDSVFFYSVKHITENQHNQASWFLNLEFFWSNIKWITKVAR